MEATLSRLALASQRAPGLRSFEILKRYDAPRLRAFFLSFDFGQRRAYFGGGISDASIGDYCETIDWDNLAIIARSGPACIDAAAILSPLSPRHATVELSIACPLFGHQRQVVAELLDLAIDVAALRYRKLIVNRDLANPDLLSLLRERPEAVRFGIEIIEVLLGIAQPRTSVA